MAIDRRKFLNDAGTMSLLAMAFPDDVFSQQANQPSASAQSAAPVTPATTIESTTEESFIMDNPFTESSTWDNPKLEFVFEIDLDFTRVQNIDNTPAGFGRGAVYLDGGRLSGPRLNGKAVPNSGGDWAQFRPDGVLSFDARYMLEENDGTLILIKNNGFLWGKHPDTMDKIRAWIFDDGPVVPETDYYLRAFPTFEVEQGKHDWLMRHVIVGVGRRKESGNILSYYALL